QSTLEARAIARNVRMKQPATAPTSIVSGDQLSPGPSNSAGAAVTSGGTPREISSKASSEWAPATTLYRCGKFFMMSFLPRQTPAADTASATAARAGRQSPSPSAAAGQLSVRATLARNHANDLPLG